MKVYLSLSSFVVSLAINTSAYGGYGALPEEHTSSFLHSSKEHPALFPDEEEKRMMEDWADLPTSSLISPSPSPAAKVGNFALNDLHEMAVYADAAYVDRNTQASPRNWEIIRKLESEGCTVSLFGTPAENSGLVIEKPNGEIIIAYHGTNSLRNLASDLWVNWAINDELEGRFHNGFLNGFEQTQNHVLAILTMIASERNQNIEDLSISVTGHSLGAALAGICAKWLDEVKGVKNLRAALFACPRFIDMVGAKDYQNRPIGKNTVVIAEDRDLVVKMNPEFLGSNHIGQMLLIPKASQDWSHTLKGYQNGLAILDQANVQNNNQGAINAKAGKTYRFEAAHDPAIKDSPFQEKVIYPFHKKVKKVKDSAIKNLQKGYKDFSEKAGIFAEKSKKSMKQIYSKLSDFGNTLADQAKNGYNKLVSFFS